MTAHGWLIAAAETAEPGSPTAALVQYGVLGIIVAALGPFAYLAYKREAARADRLEARLEELNRINVEKIIPAIVAATDAVRDAQHVARTRARER